MTCDIRLLPSQDPYDVRARAEAMMNLSRKERRPDLAVAVEAPPEAVSAVAAAETEPFDACFVTGDLVDYGSDPVRCLLRQTLGLPLAPLGAVAGPKSFRRQTGQCDQLAEPVRVPHQPLHDDQLDVRHAAGQLSHL